MSVSNLKVGDRIVAGQRCIVKAGCVGTVVVKDDNGGGYDVVFDGVTDGHDGEAYDSSKNHWYIFNGEDYELVPPAKPKPSAKPTPSIAADLRLKPQSKTVLRHLRKHGFISPAKALIVYNISRLAACVYDLREAGHTINMTLCTDEQGHRYAKYALVK